LLTYAELPTDLQEANRLNVRDIPIKLASVGYIMILARSNEPSFHFPGKHVEILAEDEHERWNQSMLDEVKKQHPCLVLWKELPKDEKEKDRDLVRGIPMILTRAGYAVVKANR